MFGCPGHHEQAVLTAIEPYALAFQELVWTVWGNGCVVGVIATNVHVEVVLDSIEHALLELHGSSSVCLVPVLVDQHFHIHCDVVRNGHGYQGLVKYKEVLNHRRHEVNAKIDGRPWEASLIVRQDWLVRSIDQHKVVVLIQQKAQSIHYHTIVDEGCVVVLRTFSQFDVFHPIRLVGQQKGNLHVVNCLQYFPRVRVERHL